MANYNPPLEDLPIFDNLVFIDPNAPITKSYADKHYLKYPTAQGTENLKAINVAGLATFNNQAIMNDTLTIADGAESSDIIQDAPSNTLVVRNNVNSGAVDIQTKDSSGTTTTPLIINSSGVTASTTGGGNISLSAKETSTGNIIFLIPDALTGAWGPSATAGNLSVVGRGTKNSSSLHLTTWTDDYSAIKINPQNVNIGAGGTANTPANSVVVNNNNVINTTVAGTRCLMAYNGGQKFYGLEVVDTVSNDILGMYAYANENWDNAIVNLGDKAIVGAGSTNNESLALTVSSATTTGMRISANDVIIGSGGTGNNPTNRIEFNGSTTTTTLTGPSLAVNNTNVNFSSTTPPTSSQTIPAPTDSSTIIPTTAWVQSAISASPPVLPEDANFRSVTIAPVASVNGSAVSYLSNVYNLGGINGLSGSTSQAYSGGGYSPSTVPSIQFRSNIQSSNVYGLNAPCLFELIMYYYSGSSVGQTSCKILIFPSALQGDWGTPFLATDTQYNINNKINGNDSFTYSSGTYAPYGRQYWTFDQQFSGVSGANAYLRGSNISLGIYQVSIWPMLFNSTTTWSWSLRCLNANGATTYSDPTGIVLTFS